MVIVKKERAYICETCFYPYSTQEEAEKCENKKPEKQPIPCSKSYFQENNLDYDETTDWKVGNLVRAESHGEKIWFAQIIGKEQYHHILRPVAEPILVKSYKRCHGDRMILLGETDRNDLIASAKALENKELISTDEEGNKTLLT